MTAKEARAKVEAAIEADNQSQYVQVYAAIDKAVEDKKLELSWGGELTQYVEDKLKADGYRIGARYYQKNEYSVTISW